MGSVWPLSGRAAELRVITDAITGANPRGVVLAGSAGVGKTRLAQEALTSARRRGQRCRSVVATASGRSVPLSAFAEFTTELGPDPLARFRDVIDAVTRDSGTRPLLIGIDDAHLLDDQSALVVHHLARRKLATIVATVRAGESAPDAITALWKDQLLHRLDVAPLPHAETVALLERVLDGQIESSSAQRLWRRTRGNLLYLRQLISDDLARSRLVQRSGVWVWNDSGRVSETLAELIDAALGRQRDDVIDVLDALTVCEPLAIDVLAAVTSPDSVNEAQSHGLITVDDAAVAHLAHPMLGDVRRTRAATLRVRTLRARVGTELGRRGERGDLIRLVRSATLLADSDVVAPAQLFIQAAQAARLLMDPTIAERLARRAVDSGGGRVARRAHMSALIDCDRVDDALALNANLIESAETERDRVFQTLVRVVLLLRRWSTGAAAALLDATYDLADQSGLSRLHACLVALLAAMQNRPRQAVETATEGLTRAGWLPPSFEIVGVLALTLGCGELGRLDDIDRHIEHAYDLARTAVAAPQARFDLAVAHINALVLGGRLAEAARVADRMAAEPMEFAWARAHRALLNGLTAAARGDLAGARRWLQELLAIASTLQTPSLIALGQRWLTVVTAMSGRAPADSSGPVSGDVLGSYARHAVLAEAWTYAANGLVRESIRDVHTAAVRARREGCLAREVVCLQTAAQFGDPGGAGRLAELCDTVQGPRVIAAARHATTLRDSDADGLIEAARLYETLGDRIAAADAAAQAEVVHRMAGRRGAALTATAMAHRLSADTGAATPALRANNIRIPLTERQREILALAAAGLSNRDIAQRLSVSVRTVEGHLFRASQRAGLNSRQQLIDLIVNATQPGRHG